MNLLHLTHLIGEGRLAIDSLADLIVQAIDNDSTVPIDEWDCSAIVTGPDGATYDLAQFETVELVGIMINEWGYKIVAQTDSGTTIEWTITLTIAGGPHDEEDDDPRCVCGVYRSEHMGQGCSEGFQSPESWEKERTQIQKDAYESVHSEASLGAVLDTYGYDEDDYSDIVNLDWD